MKAGLRNLKSYVPEPPEAAVRARYHLEKLARLSANENPYGTSPAVARALLPVIQESLNRYPDPAARKLREKVSEFYGLDPAQLVFGSGLDEVIELVSRAFLTPGDEVLMASPTFAEYGLHAKVEGARVVPVPVDQESGHFDFAGARAAVNPRTRLIWLCSPNNPTGVLEDPEAVAAFAWSLPEDVLVLVDEAYVDFAGTGASCVQLVGDLPNLAVLRTFSKAYGLANLRVGYAVMPKRLAAVLEKIRLSYNLSTPAQVAAAAAFGDQEFLEKVTAENARERERWQDFLRSQGVRFYDSRANFIYLTVPRAAELAQTLLENGIQVRTGLEPGWLRLTIGRPEDNRRMQALVKQHLEG